MQVRRFVFLALVTVSIAALLILAALTRCLRVVSALAIGCCSSCSA